MGVAGALRAHRIGRELGQLGDFVAEDLVQHDPTLTDGREALHAALCVQHHDGFRIAYQRLHRVLAEGSFVLAVSEGFLEWKNDNGKF